MTLSNSGPVISLSRYCSESETTASSRHPERSERSERSEGSFLTPKEEILRCAQDYKHLRALPFTLRG
jgi:hypothetical protein